MVEHTHRGTIGVLHVFHCVVNTPVYIRNIMVTLLSHDKGIILRNTKATGSMVMPMDG